MNNMNPNIPARCNACNGLEYLSAHYIGGEKTFLCGPCVEAQEVFDDENLDFAEAE